MRSTSKQCHRQWTSDVSMVLRSKRTIRNLSYINLQYYWLINVVPSNKTVLSYCTSHQDISNSGEFVLRPRRMAVGPRGVAFDLGIKRLLCDDRKDDESFWGRDRILVNTTTGLRTWWTRLIWISHVMNTTDMDFARDKHDWYGKISSVLLSTHAHMFVLRVKVQYMIKQA